MSTKPVPAFKIHVAKNGQIWFAAPDQMPVSAMCKLSEFVQNIPFSGTDIVKVIATQQNVDLILRLYEMKLNGKFASLQVCTPSVCPANERKGKAEIALMDAAQWNGWPASVGGWHEFGEADFPSYYLAKHYASKTPHDTISNVLKTHPAWKALQFIPHLNEEKCGRLLGKLLDPRWFVDIDEPEKTSKLEGFLGLTPNTQEHVTGSAKGTKCLGYDNCKLVTETWRMGRPVSKEEYFDPRNFLWRIHASEDNGYMADLRTSQAFIVFLKSVWLVGLYKDNPVAGGDGLFVPEYFFKYQDEWEAFKAYMGPSPRDKNEKKRS